MFIEYTREQKNRMSDQEIEVATTRKSEDGATIQDKRIWVFRNYCMDENAKLLGEYSTNEGALFAAGQHVDATGHSVRTLQQLK